MIIGYIGLGFMGMNMAKRLVAVGHEVVGFDVDPKKVAAATAWNIKAGASVESLAETVDMVLISVGTSAAVESVVRQLSASKALAGKIVVDLSTTEIGVTQRIAALLREAQISFLDAPVSGGPPMAESGDLAIMVGGNAVTYGVALPVLEQMGTPTLMGGVGAGQATKLVNQVLCLTNYVVVAESFRVAEAFGIDLEKVPQALEPGLGNSAALQAMFPRMAENDFSPRAYAYVVLKDLELLHQSTRDMHLAMPMASQALTLFRAMVAQGKGDLDGSGVVTLLPPAQKGATT